MLYSLVGLWLHSAFMFSVCKWFVLSLYFCFSLVCFSYEGLSIYLHRGNYVPSSTQCWNYSWFVVFPLLSWISSIPFRLWFWSLVSLQTYSTCFFWLSWKLCLMALIHWNVLNLVRLLGLVGIFYILLSLLSLSFYIFCSTMLLLVFSLSLRMFFFAAYSMVLTRQHCASSDCVLVLYFHCYYALFMKLRQICSICVVVSWRFLFILPWLF